MIILTVVHNIFLTKEEARKLHSGLETMTIGTSIPVWSSKGNTSEPAEEVFCQYRLTNKDERESVKIEKHGYTINLPQIPKDFKLPEVSDENWLKMNIDERSKWYENFPEVISSHSVLPVAEGGSGFLHFKEYNKIKKDKKLTTVIHVVEIKLEESLINSLA